MSKTPTIVIVPGAWHCPKHYKYLIDGLVRFHYEVVGVTVLSVNSSPPHASWDQDAQEIRRVIMESLDSGKDVIAVAHSFGGVSMSEAVKGLGKEAREKQGVKGGVVRLVYMCAMALPEGQTHLGQIQPQTPEEEELERQRQELQIKYGGIRFTPDGAMLLDKDAVRDVFYNRCDSKDVDEAVDLLGSFPAGPLAVPVTYTAYREIPSTYIVCENDRALPLPYQERMIAQGEGVFQPHFLVYAHDRSNFTTTSADDTFYGTLAAAIFELRRIPTIEATSTPFLDNSGIPDVLADNACIASQNNVHTSYSPVLNISHPIIGSSPYSPINLLNSKLNPTILDGRLARIYDTIVTGCAARYINYDCNLYATPYRYYSLEGDDCSSLQEQKPADLSHVSEDNLSKTPSPMSPSGLPPSTPDHSLKGLEPITLDLSHNMTVLGAIRFLDHFSHLYGNRLTDPDCRKSDDVLKAVFRTFSLQWLSPTDSPSVQSTTNGVPGRETTCDSAMNAFNDSWVWTRSLIFNALSVQSFRVICAMVMFDGISIPAQAPGVEHEFLDTGLQKLDHLTGLVGQYCANLRSQSTYRALVEASLSVVRWCGHVRYIGAALSTDHQYSLPSIAPHKKEQELSFTYYEPTIPPWIYHQSFDQNLDDSVPKICRAAVAEAFRVWGQIVALKSSCSNLTKDGIELCSDPSAAIASTVQAVTNFSKAFLPFLKSFIEKLGDLSMPSRVSSVSILMFWNLGVFVLTETLKPAMIGFNSPWSCDVFARLQAYTEEATSSVARTVQNVLSLPVEEIFNLQNGMSTEATIFTYHITPSLMAAALQKTIEAIVGMQPYLLVDADALWKEQINITMKGLVSLEVTVGGLHAARAAIGKLTRDHGDIISECWSSSDFET
ncbi:Alpha/beta hydrolase family-domain-containing protein [Aspergillus coremiiformis]|uniref:Alpha/beta hydrolase family-domain-containing protein n=1 Tax=Aspergillus coremiiformis TaxID=138285 RepID=A0A5N6ZFB7_9EURO|nr:Alpha/beta hydrolase family-domain-containing protein [Aspergillus coremiiformis]